MKKSAPHVFQCKYCGQIIKSLINPSSLKCDVGFYHSWGELGVEGNTTYECEKCATNVKLLTAPSSLNCPSGNKHIWKKIV